MIKVFLIVVACLEPKYVKCQWLEVVEVIDMRACHLNRPLMASAWQLRVNDGWLTFTRCEYVNPEKNGRRG